MTTINTTNTGKPGSTKTDDHNVATAAETAPQTPAAGVPEPTPQAVVKAPDPAPDDSLDPKVEKELTDIVAKIGGLEGTELDDLRTLVNKRLRG
jgi:hypothetical protein